MQPEVDEGDQERFIEWDDDRYSTGIERFDDQHRRLFELLNDLSTAMDEGRSEEAVGEILRELERYTEYHFGDEEEFMQDCGFAMDCANCFYNHREMHEQFAEKVSELREKHEAGKTISMEVLLFARDWLDSHIAGLNQDQNYSEYYEDKVGEDYEYEPGKLKADRDSEDPHEGDDASSEDQQPTASADNEPTNESGIAENTTDEQESVTIASEVYSGEELSVPSESTAVWLESTVDEYGDRTATVELTDDGRETRPFKELYKDAVAVAGGLLDMGLEPGDRVGIHAAASTQWTTVEMACHLAGLVSVPLSPLFDTNRARHVCQDAGLELLVTDSNLPEGVEELVSETRSIDALPTGRADSLPGFEADPDDPVTILYRVDTTEHPNGCAITHRNLRATIEMLDTALPLDPGATGTCFLPLAHPYQRVLTYHLWNTGGTVAYTRRNQLLDDLRTVQPSVLIGVPTVYERLHEEIENRREESGGLTGSLASGVAESVGNAKTEGRSVSTSLSLKHTIANKTVFANLREEVGLGNIEYALTGTAAIDRELLDFFRGFDVPLSEIYGATELTGFATINRAGAYDVETVGGPLPGVEIALAEDDEVLVRGPNVIDGYWADAMTWREKLSDGWYLTGDLGAFEEDALVIEGPK
ncbi:bacteriohemerythrin [Halovenus sp. HT40]|uniref:bacteriohemerythrin n=1 Tax=Halovenus sp. HT40 TaxID=3126691 RepID=UPI00300E862B